MTGRRGWLIYSLAAAFAVAGTGGAHAAGGDDMKACAAVGSAAVRLACFDAAAKSAETGDVAACAKVASDTVRLACFDAAAGGAPVSSTSASSAPAVAAPAAAAPARKAAPAAAPAADMVRSEEIMRTREAAMKARLAEMERQAAEMERRAAEIEERAAAAAERAAPPADPAASFGGKSEEAQAAFGDHGAEANDPLTAKTYGKATEKSDEDGDDPEQIKKIAVPIKIIKKDPYGKISVTLENGQVWKQVDATRARWHKDGENVAHIRRAFLGSFLMTINDEGAALRVRRVK